jgi:hypothetical protein
LRERNKSHHHKFVTACDILTLTGSSRAYFSHCLIIHFFSVYLFAIWYASTRYLVNSFQIFKKWSIISIVLAAIVMYMDPGSPSKPLQKENRWMVWGNEISLYLRIVDGTKGSFSRKKQQPLEHTTARKKIYNLKMKSGWFWFLSLLLPTDFSIASHHKKDIRFEIWNLVERVAMVGRWCIDP